MFCLGLKLFENIVIPYIAYITSYGIVLASPACQKNVLLLDSHFTSVCPVAQVSLLVVFCILPAVSDLHQLYSVMGYFSFLASSNSFF